MTVENTGRSLAFQVHLKLIDPATGDEVLPVFWEANYFELMPGEKRDIRVAYPRGLTSRTLGIEADGWNVARARYK